MTTFTIGTTEFPNKSSKLLFLYMARYFALYSVQYHKDGTKCFGDFSLFRTRKSAIAYLAGLNFETVIFHKDGSCAEIPAKYGLNYTRYEVVGYDSKSEKLDSATYALDSINENEVLGVYSSGRFGIRAGNAVYYNDGTVEYGFNV